jgi:hypothetical protein
MKCEYLRVDVLRILELSHFGLINSNNSIRYDSNLQWLQSLPNVEYRQDYECFFVLKGSPSHTAIAMKLGDIFD